MLGSTKLNFGLQQNKIYVESGKESIKRMMKDIKSFLPESIRTQGWKNPKFHLLLHYIDTIQAYGAPKNYDSQCPEHNHKYLAKLPGHRAQKTNVGSEFEKTSSNKG